MADETQQPGVLGNVGDFLKDPKNLATVAVLTAALLQPRDQGRGGLATFAQRGVGALAFRGGVEGSLAAQERQRTLDTQNQENRVREQALEGERNKISAEGVGVQREGIGVQREGQKTQAQIARERNQLEVQLRNTPQARDPAAQNLDAAQAGYYNRLPAFAPNDKIDLTKMFTKDAMGAKALMSSVSSIASMTDPLERSKMLADYYPLMGQFGIIMGQDPKTGAISFQVPDDLATQIRSLGGARSPVPSGTQPGPSGPPTAPAPTNLNLEQVLARSQELQQQKQQKEQVAAQTLKTNAAAYRAARTQLMPLSDVQLRDLGSLSSSMDDVTRQALADELRARQSLGPPADPRRPGMTPVPSAPLAPYRQ